MVLCVVYIFLVLSAILTILHQTGQIQYAANTLQTGQIQYAANTVHHDTEVTKYANDYTDRFNISCLREPLRTTRSVISSTYHHYVSVFCYSCP